MWLNPKLRALAPRRYISFSWSILLYVIESATRASVPVKKWMFQLKYSSLCDWIWNLLRLRVLFRQFQLKYSSLCDWISWKSTHWQSRRKVSVEVFFSMWLNPFGWQFVREWNGVSVEVFFSMWLNRRARVFGTSRLSFSWSILLYVIESPKEFHCAHPWCCFSWSILLYVIESVKTSWQ